MLTFLFGMAFSVLGWLLPVVGLAAGALVGLTIFNTGRGVLVGLPVTLGLAVGGVLMVAGFPTHANFGLMLLGGALGLGGAWWWVKMGYAGLGAVAVTGGLFLVLSSTPGHCDEGINTWATGLAQSVEGDVLGAIGVVAPYGVKVVAMICGLILVVGLMRALVSKMAK